MKQPVAVLGLGYVGLPLAGACHEAGFSVVGFDVNTSVVSQLHSGSSHVDDVDDTELQRWLEDGLVVTADPDQIKDATIFVICVPTPLTDVGDPDLSAVISAGNLVASCLGRTQETPLVILESTTYPGTTEEVLRPLLEKSGTTAGVGFSLAFSPERVDPGNPEFTIRNTVNLVGGFTDACTSRARDFYTQFVDQVVTVSGLREAEMAKLLENTYRHVNIALVNEFVKVCFPLGIDFWEVVRAAATKPYGFQAFYPGPGVGGHCIPIDPKYLSHKVMAELGQTLRFVELASDINSAMPQYVVSRIQGLLNEQYKPAKGSRVLLLGVTYKRDIADLRESPAYGVVRHLRLLGAEIEFHDPYIECFTVDDVEIRRIEDVLGCARRADAVILLQNHTLYSSLLDQLECSVLFDTRGVTDGLQHKWKRL